MSGQQPPLECKTKEMVVDLGKYLGVHIIDCLTWEPYKDSAVRKARQRLFHLRHLRKFWVSPQILDKEFFLLYIILDFK